MMNKSKKESNLTGLEIAVIGMAGRFPGANNIYDFWNNLKNGIESVYFFSSEELLEAGIDENLIDHPRYVKAKQVIEGKEYFDSSFFDYLPEEAGLMDPQTRIFHECVWEALEDAGYNADDYAGLMGLYAGTSSNFAWEAFAMISGSDTAIDSFTAGQLRARDFLTTRVSHKLNLKGPAVFIQTACSTSLAAIHMACRGLLTGDCHIALAGGITITNSYKEGYLYQEGVVLSPDGHCRAFDAKAGGTVGGEGAAVVVLKKLKNAAADRDNIRVVIKASAINNDGLRRVGFSAPSVDGQADVIRLAHKMARIEPQSITYIETHGTATSLGDPIEVEALAQVFGNAKEKYCALGSVKTNIGHLDTAAGAAGFIKTVLALMHRQLPPGLNFTTPNPRIDFENTPFYVNTTLKEWKNHNYPLRAGVSSFGIGGTNVHVILEEFPGRRGGSIDPPLKSREYHLILLSAKTLPALDRMTRNLLEYFKKNLLNHGNHENPVNPGLNIADAAYTLQTGRKTFSHRLMLVCKDISRAIHILSSPTLEEIKTFSTKKEKKFMVFMFPGQGSQYVDMGRELYEQESIFRQEMNRCFDILKPQLDYDIKEILYPGDPGCRGGYTYPPIPVNSPGINQTEIAQPLLFIIEFSLAKLLMKWGITPDIMIGHSIGEYVAACISGVFSLEDALRLVNLRGKLIQGLPAGSMSSIPLSEREVLSWLGKYNTGREEISLAAVNSSQLCVVSGSSPVIDSFEADIKAAGVKTRRLHTSHAFHSVMMEPILEEFKEAIRQVSTGKLQIPYISNLTGKVVEPQEVAEPIYWSKHIRQTVRFSQGVEVLLGHKNAVFIEVGPGQTLGTFIRQHTAKENSHKIINMIRHPGEKTNDLAYLLEKIGELWLYGVSPRWDDFHQGRLPKRVSLPPYSFEKIPYPIGTDVSEIIKNFCGGGQKREDRKMRKMGSQGVFSDFNLHSFLSSQLHSFPLYPLVAEGQKIQTQRPEMATAYIEASTPMERVLQGIWENFFHIDKIGIKDNFFELGGDSLKAMTLSAKIQERLHVEIRVADFFVNPTIKDLAGHIGTSKKKELGSIDPVEEKQYYLVSSAQKRLYFHYCMNVGSTDYNLAQAYGLGGEIDLEKLEGVFRELIQRHESFRTSFHMIAGEPVQRIHEEVEFEIEFYDLATADRGQKTDDGRQTTEGKPDAHLSSVICHLSSEFIRPFDLSQAPLLRVGIAHTMAASRPPLFKGDKKENPRCEYLLIIDMHHIITDGTSLGILASEFVQLYRGNRLSGLKVRYRDYARWQQRKYETGEIKKQETYWLKQFAGDIPWLDMPTDYPRPAPGSRTYDGEKVVIQIDKGMLEKIDRLVSLEGITLFILLLAVFNILLSKYSGKEDIVVGTGSAGRGHANLAGIIGLFIHVLPMRNYPHKDKTFTRFLNEVKNSALQAYENEDFPFEELVKALKVQGKTPLNPLFDAAFESMNLELPGTGQAREKEISLKTSSETIPQAAHYDITIYAIQTANSLEMSMVYAAELFKSSTAQKMADRYLEILNQVLENKEIKLKDIRVSGMEVLTEPEKNRLLLEFNQITGEDIFPPGYPGDRLIHRLFEQQVEKTPDALAVAYRQQSLTYRQLNEQTDELACLLRAKGVTADALVALIVEPSIETVTGILGILKAGGAYLPIHHETPTERLLLILKDSRVSLVLTQNHILRQQSFTVLQGLRHRQMKPYKTKPRPHITDFDSIPFPNRSLVNYEKYNKYIGHNLIQDCISLQATRGCPFKCAYCHKIWPKKHVPRSAENVFAEVLFNYNLGIRRFSFVDDIFNFNRENSRRFFELIIQHQMDLYLFFLMRGDMLTQEYIDLMVKAGLVRLGLALETASPRLQKLIGKHLNIEKLRTNLEYIAKKYPQVILELYTMHGFPTETKPEAMMTLNFIKTIKWLHFPYIFVLTIYPNTEMEKLALDNGIPPEAIDRSLNLAYHELPDTLPFEKDFSIKYQAEFLNDYFLSKERLLHVLPQQMKILTEAEMVQKYNSYLPVDIKSFDHLLEFFGLHRQELTVKQCMDQKRVFVPYLNTKYKAAYPTIKPAENAFKILLLDLSQNFSTVHGQLDEMIEPPLGLMYLLTYLNRQYREKINGKIAKSMIDFDSFAELKALLEAFSPQLIGIRTLSLYKDFFHETVQKIRHWGITVPIITGGPYATSSYHTLLQDTNLDLVVLGEGEITIAELVGKIMENNGNLPAKEELKEIAGIVFIPGNEKKPGKYPREIITLPSATRGGLFLKKASPPGPLPQKLLINETFQLVYSIFTSGSTGVPKGVMLEHRQVSRLVYGLKERIYSRYSQPMHISLVAPYVFDASVKQIFAALLLGHALHIVPEDIRVDGPALLKFYKKHCIDVSDGTPTLIRMILETLNQFEPGSSLTLKHLIIGGEPLPKEKVRELYNRCKNLTITNVYGPTEATVDSTSFEVTPQTLGNYNTIPIGKPMPFDCIYILNKENRLVPPGVPGELHIGGGKLARGYLNRPELTSDKFIMPSATRGCAIRGNEGACPLVKHATMQSCNHAASFTPLTTHQSPITTHHSTNHHSPLTIYKTGDQARWLSDGNIEFLGRIDHQVKIRGIRIELEEIENRLTAYKEIKQALVTTRADDQGTDCLCAYIVTGNKIDTTQLRRNLTHILPDYMIPAYFVQLAELPLTPGGKIDRKALPHPAEVGLDLGDGQMAAPRDPIEEQLVEIIKQVLGRKRVGIHENIFTLGADSIKTIQVAYGMKKAGYKLEIKDIFEFPTAAALAPRVSKIKQEADRSVITGEVPLTPVQEEFFQLYKIDPHHFNHSVMFYSEKRLDPGVLEAVVIKLQEHHDALRMTYERKPRGKILQWNHGLEYPHWIRVYDFQNREDAHEVLKTTCNQVQASIDLEKGPLLKVALFRLADGDRLLVVLHHLVVDGMSWRILFEDIGTLYSHYREHPRTEPPQLSPKSDSCKLWGERVGEYANTPGFLAEKNYWAQVESSLEPPIKRDLDEETTYIEDLDNLSFSLTEAETDRLFTKVSPALGVEVWHILLFGIGAAFKKAFGQEKLLVALEGHGREAILPGLDIGRTVGWFTGIYPVVLDFSREMELPDRVREVKEMLSRVPNKGIGYGILKYITAGEHKKEIEFKLKPQIGFNYLGQFDTDVGRLSFVMAQESPGHTHSLRGIRKYDFTVTGIAAEQRLMISIAYSKKQYKVATAAAILFQYQGALSEIIQAQ
jgi:amino acid adenylation domain-containing protein/non-ribosomal peptide synthase protein (TIGR01720 family)